MNDADDKGCFLQRVDEVGKCYLMYLFKNSYFSLKFGVYSQILVV